MFKRIAFVGIGLACVAAPLVSSAQTVTAVTVSGLQVQVRGLLAQLQALQMQAGTSAPASVSGSAGPIASVGTGSACPTFARSLSVGATGSDVTALQEFLSARGFLGVSATGYFGPLTAAAVGKWQVQNAVTSSNNAGFGVFGPLSRALFSRTCSGSVGSTGSSGSGTTQGAGFTASPTMGAAPLTVQFISTAPQGTTPGNTVSFGDGASGSLGFVPTCSSCNAEGVVTHTYTSPGTYTAELTGGACACPLGSICNCPNMQIIGTATITVPATSSAPDIEQVNVPGSVTLSQGGIAEVRNESMYFTLESLTDSSATIQTTPVGCWNSFPSDPKPQVVCMIAMIPAPPQTLSVGQTYTSANYALTLTQIQSGKATFSMSAASSQ